MPTLTTRSKRQKMSKADKGMPIPTNRALAKFFYNEDGSKLSRSDYYTRKEELKAIGNEESFRLTNAQYELREEGACVGQGLSLQEQQLYRPSERKLVYGGAWITVVQDIPVDPDIAPKKYCTYWATPWQKSKNLDGYDEYGRYKVEVLVKRRNLGIGRADLFEFVSLFPHEYVIVEQEELDGLIEDEEVVLHTYGINDESDEDMSKELLERKMALTPEEREIIDSFMLDGLNHVHACQEYFMSKHVETNNRNIYYEPAPEIYRQLVNQFG